MLQWCRLFKRLWNLPTGHYVAGVQTVKVLSEPTCRALRYSGAGSFKAVSEPTCRALCNSGADCLSGVRTHLPGTMLQWCRLFKQCQNLPAGHCVTVVQTVKVVSEPTYQALCYSGAGWLSNVGTYLPGTVLQGCRLLKYCLNLPALRYSDAGS